ncbi:MAG: aminotransferase class V-fold PLP-dependent enzyme [Enterocloster clostridioformis]
MPIDVDEYNIDMLSSSGHKLNGPKELVSLYPTGVKIRSFITEAPRSASAVPEQKMCPA